MNQIQSHVSLSVISNAVCRQFYGNNVILDSTICTSGAGGVGTCGGDSGGPLVIFSGPRRVLVCVARSTVWGKAGSENLRF